MTPETCERVDNVKDDTLPKASSRELTFVAEGNHYRPFMEFAGRRMTVASAPRVNSLAYFGGYPTMSKLLNTKTNPCPCTSVLA